MKQYKCDQTGLIVAHEPDVTLKGYTRKCDGGILMPERFHEKHFGTREAFIEWMRVAIKQEDEG